MAALVDRICRYVATLGPIGFLPGAPGTYGTLCALPLFFFYRQALISHPWLLEEVGTLVLVLASYWVITRALRTWVAVHDPQQIVLDEVMGLFVTFLHFPFYSLQQLPLIALGVLYFRFFDIYKPISIERLERIPGALGVMADDIAAGLLAHVCLSLTVQFLF